MPKFSTLVLSITVHHIVKVKNIFEVKEKMRDKLELWLKSVEDFQEATRLYLEVTQRQLRSSSGEKRKNIIKRCKDFLNMAEPILNINFQQINNFIQTQNQIDLLIEHFNLLDMTK